MIIAKSNIDTAYINKNRDMTEGGKNSSASAPKNNSGNVLYAGNLKLNDNIIGDKKLQEQKKALKTLMDQFKSEGKIDNTVTELQDKKSKLLRESASDSNTIRELQEKKQELMDSYGITDDSDEQRTLMESEDKYMDLYLKSIQHPDKMSEEDNAVLQSAMDALTDYQKDAFRYDAMEKIWEGRVSDSIQNSESIDAALTGIKLERLKTHPMVDSQKQAEEITKDASKDIIGTIIQQTKDKVDEQTEENKEKAEKEQEEQDKKEQEAEKAKQKEETNDISKMSNANNKDNIQATVPDETSISQSEQQKLLNNIKRVADKQKMTEDDIKGIVVDEQV